MIKPEDCEFHFKPDSHWQWVETLALPFSVPEANINGIIYVLTRPMLGVCMSDITLFDRISDLWEEQLYIDNQQHMPCPKSMLDFSLPNGLSIKVVEPLKRYRVAYEGIDNTGFERNTLASKGTKAILTIRAWIRLPRSVKVRHGIAPGPVTMN